MKLNSDNAKALWEWKGQKELDEVKQAILADRKNIQKWANRLVSGKKLSGLGWSKTLRSINDLKKLQISLRCLIENEEHFLRVKKIKQQAEQ